MIPLVRPFGEHKIILTIFCTSHEMAIATIFMYRQCGLKHLPLKTKARQQPNSSFRHSSVWLLQTFFFYTKKQGEIHATTRQPSLRRVGNDALFLYPDFVCGGCRGQVVHNQKKGTRHGQKKDSPPENSRLRLEGACDWRRREITAKPPIRPTGSLRIALGERCFREPSRATPLAHYKLRSL